MKTFIEILEEKIIASMAQVTGQQDCAAIVAPATDPKFGDYQANGVMALAKKLKINPRKLAEEVVNKLITEPRTTNHEPRLIDICETPEVAGPGFINLRLKPDFVAKILLEISKHYVEEEFPGNIRLSFPRFGIDKVADPKTIVVDFSGPNIAKEMHVGHLRSTIIGDCICRILYFLGHKVIKHNHIGDWGTQFGMLCALYERKRDKAIKRGENVFPYLPLADLESFYKEAKKLFDTDEEFARQSREAVARLHLKDDLWMSYWREIVRQSEKHFQEIYDTLHITLGFDEGESFYKDMLPDVVEELLKRKIAEKSEDAVCVFPPGFKNKESKPLPFMIQKSDGAYLYATTDLAALRYRVQELKADKIIYVTDARQKLHFEMLFATARMAGWDLKQKSEDRRQKTEDRSLPACGGTELVHVMFGSVLGEDGTPLKTREGENVKLKELLDEAVVRSRKIVEEKNPDLSVEQKERIAKAVGIGAVKYADFSNSRTSDYVFSFDKMLAMEGNTAPYMQYAYARIKSIERKAQDKGIDYKGEIANLLQKSEDRRQKTEDNLSIVALAKTERQITNYQLPISIYHSAELDLAKHLIRYGEAIEAAIADYRPNYLTTYLYELAQKFSVFYTNCPVLDAGPDKRPTRLLLCDLTANTIKHGLSELLGIEVVEQM